MKQGGKVKSKTLLFHFGNTNLPEDAPFDGGGDQNLLREARQIVRIRACRAVLVNQPVNSPLRHSIGRNIKYLIDRKDETYVFRLHKDRVYYVR